MVTFSPLQLPRSIEHRRARHLPVRRHVRHLHSPPTPARPHSAFALVPLTAALTAALIAIRRVLPCSYPPVRRDDLVCAHVLVSLCAPRPMYLLHPIPLLPPPTSSPPPSLPRPSPLPHRRGRFLPSRTSCLLCAAGRASPCPRGQRWRVHKAGMPRAIHITYRRAHCTCPHRTRAALHPPRSSPPPATAPAPG